MNPFAPTFSDAAMFVYHYTTMKTALKHIFPEKRIKFARYCNTNDPKEYKDWHFDLWTNGMVRLTGADRSQLSDRLSYQLQKKTRLFCVSRDQQPLNGNHLWDMNRRGFAKPRMWAQYAETRSRSDKRRQGVCLVFDRNKLDDQIRLQCAQSCKIASGEVIYQDRAFFGRQISYTINMDALEKFGFERYSRSHLENNIASLFFEKVTDWREEREFRWLLFSDREDDFFVDYKGALVGIVFGVDARSTDIDSVIELAGQPEIAHVGLKWQNSNLWYDYSDMRYSPQFRKFRRQHRRRTTHLPKSLETK